MPSWLLFSFCVCSPGPQQGLILQNGVSVQAMLLLSAKINMVWLYASTPSNLRMTCAGSQQLWFSLSVPVYQ